MSTGHQCVRALACALACVSTLAACGGSAPKPDPIQEARVVAEVNGACRHELVLPRAVRRSERQTSFFQARLAVLSRTLKKTAAYLPAGKDLSEAHVARHVLEVEEAKRARAGRTRPAPDIRFDRLQLRIYDDELALGVTCAGSTARAAHETAHLLAAAAR
jgi:hypothetical protein